MVNRAPRQRSIVTRVHHYRINCLVWLGTKQLVKFLPAPADYVFVRPGSDTSGDGSYCTVRMTVSNNE